MCLCEVIRDFRVNLTVIYIAHFPLVNTDKLMTRVNIPVRRDCHILVSAAAAPQSLDRAGSLIKVYHVVEEIERLFTCLFDVLRHDAVKPVVLVIYLRQVFLGYGVGSIRRCGHRLHR